ncbi:transcription initiation factor TFIID subunit 4-like [Corvus moneduloides]|uniref:transcription initiation factor TFIID subunit 4-like n=1 Tax=Corvus moneduloides TaxID=1196302 RepID=UPI001363A793|nr:transcription initiation factor TFIID subunit 4-like [Corvus moneduloides]
MATNRAVFSPPDVTVPAELSRGYLPSKVPLSRRQPTLVTDVTAENNCHAEDPSEESRDQLAASQSRLRPSHCSGLHHLSGTRHSAPCPSRPPSVARRGRGGRAGGAGPVPAPHAAPALRTGYSQRPPRRLAGLQPPPPPAPLPPAGPAAPLQAGLAPTGPHSSPHLAPSGSGSSAAAGAAAFPGRSLHAGAPGGFSSPRGSLRSPARSSRALPAAAAPSRLSALSPALSNGGRRASPALASLTESLSPPNFTSAASLPSPLPPAAAAQRAPARTAARARERASSCCRWIPWEAWEGARGRHPAARARAPPRLPPPPRPVRGRARRAPARALVAARLARGVGSRRAWSSSPASGSGAGRDAATPLRESGSEVCRWPRA